MNETIESVIITQSTTPVDGQLNLNVRQAGSHEIVDASAPATLAYMMSCAIFVLVQEGAIFKKVEEMFGVNLSGMINRSEA